MIPKLIPHILKNITPSNFHFSSSKSNIPIQSLSSLFVQQQTVQSPDLLKSYDQPCDLFTDALKSLKKSQYQQEGKDKIFIQCLRKYTNNLQYVKLLVQLIIPNDRLFPDLNVLYIEYAAFYLENNKQFHKEQLYYLLQNLQRMVFELQSEWTDQDWVVRDYTRQQYLTNLIIPHIIAQKHEFDMYFFNRLTRVCNALAIRNPQLAQYLTETLQSDKNRLRLQQILTTMVYLSKMQSFPLEYFYKNKQKWLKTITSYSQYSTKKSHETIKLFQLIALTHPIHCSSLFHKIQLLLLEQIASFDNEQIANTWHLINRVKFGIQPNLIKKVMQKICESVEEMEGRDLCLLVRGFARWRGEMGQIGVKVMEKIRDNLDVNRKYEIEVIKLAIMRAKQMQN